ncbi:MAG TPA: hypothetical protein VE987_20530, partial [Polyangiaceae bacterium]|nr:hypothetical protein [Polyangiaceae bacterium]
QRLKHDDRTAFAQTLSRMADTARSEAGKATGQTKEQYAKLADQLAQAARSGELSVFRPTKHHHARHLAPHAGSSVEPFLQVLLDQIDHVLGPDASPPQTTAP